MRPSLPVLLRVFSQRELAAATTATTMKPLPELMGSDHVKKPTVIAQLLSEKDKLGKSYPINIRIEPVFERKTLKNVDPAIRDQFLEMMKEK